ncbi:MAG: hypothetical protein H7257_05275 [Taibaiella sp.]|nr:hypothetical protein [Taibaiella sp.]
MLSKRSNIIIAVMGAVFSFLSVAYVSCTKVGTSPSCNGVVCKNSGYCNRGQCVCPTGYEGTDCGVASVSKFIGAWDVKQLVTGSDTLSAIGRDSSYIVFLKNTATPTTFFIDNFLGNPHYNQLIGTIDSVNTGNFVLDTLRDINMQADKVFIRLNSKGSYNANGQITATVILRHLTPTYNWQVDTLALVLKRHNF